MPTINKELAIVGKFDISKIQRAFGDLFVGTARSKKEFQELQNSVQNNLNAISGKIRQNAKDQENAMNTIKKLKSELANPGADLNKHLKATDQLKFYEKWINHLKDTQRELKNTYKTEKELANQQLRNARLDMKQPTFMGSTTLGAMGAGRMLGIAGGVASAGIGLGALAVNNFLPFDKQMALLEATLGAKSSSTNNMVRDLVLGSSLATTRDSSEVASTANLLFSSGLRPTAKEGTQAYKDQLMQFQEVLTMLGNEARITGEDMEAISKAMIYQAKAFGLSANNANDVKRIMDSLNNTIDDGTGNMREYSAQFSKFAPAAKDAGSSMEFANATFAFMTNRYGANEAGHATKQFFEEFANSARYMSRSQNVLARMGKHDILAGTQGSDKAILSKYANKETGAKNLVSFFTDENNNMKDVETTIRDIYAVYTKLTSDTAKNNFLTAVSGGNANMLKTWRALLGSEGYIGEDGTTYQRSGIDGLAEIFKNASEKTDTQARKLGLVTDNMSDRLNVLSNTWDVNIKKFVIHLEEPINDMIDFMIAATGKIGPIAEGIRGLLGYIDPENAKINEASSTNISSNLDKIRNAKSGREANEIYMGAIMNDVEAFKISGQNHWGPEAFYQMANGPIRDAYASAGLDYGFFDIPEREHYNSAAGRILGGGEANLLQLLNQFGGDENKAKAFLGKYRNAVVENSTDGGDPAILSSIDGAIALIDKLVEADKIRMEKENEEMRTQTQLQQQMLTQLGVIANKDFGGGFSIMNYSGQKNNTSPAGAGQKAGSFLWSVPSINFTQK